MSILFKADIKSKPGVKGGAEHRYYPRIVTTQKIDLNQVAIEIERSSTLSKSVVFHVVKELELYLADKLQDGCSVHLDGLGIFRPTIQGTPALSPEELKSSNIKKVNIQFHAGKTLRDAVNMASFKKVKEK